MSMLEPDHASTTRHRNVQRGRTLQRHEDRVAAFGAIRRAAEIARSDWDDAPMTPMVIRRAIRAAIGSDKA